MNALQPCLLRDSREALLPDAPSWAAACGRALEAGDRLLTLFGRVDAATDGVLLTAVLQSASRGLSMLRGQASRQAAYPALTVRFPAAQIFERELHEQTGLMPEGHPWLKPVRFEGLSPPRMDDYPFYTLRGQEVHEVGVGPVHAGVIEPGHFRFMCHGEQVHHLEIQLGYQHRGVEALLLRRAPHALTPLVETISGDSSVAWAWAHCAAIEALSDVAVRPEVERVRGIALELERIAMHLAGLSGLATDIAFLQGGTTYGRLRTAVINASMRVCGSRFGRGWLRPGGVRHSIDEGCRQDLLTTLAACAKDLAEIDALMLGARSVRARFKGVGIVDRQAALDLGLVGPAARASGVATDLRLELPGAAWSVLPIACSVEEGGDCWARMRVRMREIDTSLAWLRCALQADDLPLGALALHRPGPLRAHAVCVSVCEGVRGPVVQVLETDAQGGLLHYKVQDPSLVNWFGLALSVRGNAISDFPLCNKSFDLSYCGNDL